MRGDDNQQEGMFSYVSPEKRVPADHPLRPIRKMVDEILKEMSPQFAKLYSDVGRPSIAPERLFRSLLLQIFDSVRSERMLIHRGGLQPVPTAKPDGQNVKEVSIRIG
jgi:transposase